MMAVPASRPAVAAERPEVEDFLFREARLLDTWDLDTWITLFTDDARYVVPNTDLPGADPRRDLIIIDDDIVRLRARVARLNNRRAHREFPHSRTRRLVTNVACAAAGRDDEVEALANFAVYRIRGGHTDLYVGRYVYRLRRAGDGRLLISYRRAELDLESLAPHGTVSIIL